MSALLSTEKVVGQSGIAKTGMENHVFHGLNIFYREAGPKNASVILLMHGFPSSSLMYRDLIDKLKEQFHSDCTRLFKLWI